MRHGNVTCEVAVDGQVVPEYGPGEDSEVVSCWIVAQEGKDYEIRLRHEDHRGGFSRGMTCLEARLYVDGASRCARSKLISAKGSVMKGLSFGALVTRDDDSDDEGGLPEHLATLRVVIGWVKIRRRVRSSGSPQNETVSVSERAASKKAGRICDRSTR